MKLVVFQLLNIVLVSAFSKMCLKSEEVTKTRLQWNYAERIVSKKSVNGEIKKAYEPYSYSTVVNYIDIETHPVCCPGYQKINNNCEPQCDSGCSDNSHCSRPNICECDGGYLGLPSFGIKCKPLCKSPCPKNAECSKPNKCSCNEGYKLNEVSNECEPICSKFCIGNSTCSAPEKCTCKQNYKFNNDTNKCEPMCDCGKYEMCLELNKCECVDNYERSKSDNVCIPKCDEKCSNNTVCSAPNQCTCKQGYKLNQLNICDPVCNPVCPANSVCTEPNKCACFNGYNMLNSTCLPVCQQCPTNSVCTSPNKCDCINGYQKKLTSLYKIVCEPVCPNCSTFAKCTAPNKCECLNGYEMDEIEQCRPICNQGCQNGICFSSNICICNPGYLMGPKGICEPVCSRICNYGRCVEPEICECLEDYKFKEKSINDCEPICQFACINGECIAPNVCICSENFVPTETENGLNHSVCEAMPTEKDEIKFSKEILETTTVNYISSEIKELGKTYTNYSKMLEITTTSSTGHIVAAEICSQQCQCWQRYNELGSINNIKCTHICINERNESCLNLSLCQCDQDMLQLNCNLDTEDQLVVYSCKHSFQMEDNLPKTTQRPTAAEPSNWPWLLIVIIIIAAVIAVAGAAFIYSRR